MYTVDVLRPLLEVCTRKIGYKGEVGINDHGGYRGQ